MNPDLELFLKTAKPEWSVRPIGAPDCASFRMGILDIDADLLSARPCHIIEQALVEEGMVDWSLRSSGCRLIVFDEKAGETKYMSLNLPTKALCLVSAWNALHKETP